MNKKIHKSVGKRKIKKKLKVSLFLRVRYFIIGPPNQKRFVEVSIYLNHKKWERRLASTLSPHKSIKKK